MSSHGEKNIQENISISYRRKVQLELSTETESQSNLRYKLVGNKASLLPSVHRAACQ